MAKSREPGLTVAGTDTGRGPMKSIDYDFVQTALHF
jgi:hypothetical protein